MKIDQRVGQARIRKGRSKGAREGGNIQQASSHGSVTGSEMCLERHVRHPARPEAVVNEVVRGLPAYIVGVPDHRSAQVLKDMTDVVGPLLKRQRVAVRKRDDTRDIRPESGHGIAQRNPSRPKVS